MLKALRKGERLPLILDENIRVGNSLVSGDEAELREVFGEAWKEEKPFDWPREFPEILDGGGFDVVLGNPPYVDIYTIPDAERQWFLRGKFRSAYKKFDLYVLFVEIGLRLLKEGGRLSYIVPDRLLTAVYAKPLRQLLLQTCAIEQIVDLSKVKVFPHQSVRNIIFVARKEPDASKRRANRVRIVNVPADADLAAGIRGAVEEIPQQLFEELPHNEFRLTLGRPELLSIAQKMERGTVPLGDYLYVNWGLRTGTTEKTRTMIVKDGSRPNAKPLIRGENIVDRYLLEYTGDHVIYDTKRLYNPMFPEFFENPKIVIRKITGGKGLFATFDDKGYYAFSTVIIALPYHSVAASPRARVPEGAVGRSKRLDPRYVLALLNSQPMRFYYRVRIGDELSVVPNQVKRLPIPVVPIEVQARLANAAARLIELRRELHEEEPLTRLERLIAARARSRDETFGTYMGRLEERDIDATGLGSVYRADAASFSVLLAGEWLEFEVEYRERGQEKPKLGKIRCRFSEPQRTFLFHVLKARAGFDLGRGRPLAKVRALKVPHFDPDWERYVRVVREVVDSLAVHERRVAELQEQIRGFELEIDDAAYSLYGLDGSDRPVVAGHRSST